MLPGIVELDEAFIGGKEPGQSQGRGQPHKDADCRGGITERQGWPRSRPLEVIDNAKGGTLLAVPRRRSRLGTRGAHRRRTRG